MHGRDFVQLALFIGDLVAITPLLGKFLARVFANERHFLSSSLGWLERGIYKLSGIDAAKEMSWQTYAIAMFVFNIVGGVVLLALEMTTAVSFVTNTNWPGLLG
jgi:K+-transporting ATPase ATPase A chain